MAIDEPVADHEIRLLCPVTVSGRQPVELYRQADHLRRISTHQGCLRAVGYLARLSRQRIHGLLHVSAPPWDGWATALSRVKLASAGLAVWSVATSLSGLALELSFASSCPPFRRDRGGELWHRISGDSFRIIIRRIKGGAYFHTFYLAIPVGSAFGYLLAEFSERSSVGRRHFSWSGCPVLLLAIPVWLLHEPERGATEKISAVAIPKRTDYASLFSNRPYIINTWP